MLNAAVGLMMPSCLNRRCFVFDLAFDLFACHVCHHFSGCPQWGHSVSADVVFVFIIFVVPHAAEQVGVGNRSCTALYSTRGG
jgi:hypothetical protein